MFGSSAKLLPYTECSTPDGNGQLTVCRDAGISSYPTWEFAGGNRVSGVVSFDELSELTSCPLPDGSIVGETENEVIDEANPNSTEVSEENV
jgi:hypothetical protein